MPGSPAGRPSMSTRSERVLMILTAGVLAAMGAFLLARGSRLPQGRWSKPAAFACALAALWPLACWLAARQRPDEGPAALAELRSRADNVYLGRGYPWTPECARRLRDAAMAAQQPAPPRSRDLYLPEHELARHVLILGTTGSGKTPSGLPWSRACWWTNQGWAATNAGSRSRCWGRW